MGKFAGLFLSVLLLASCSQSNPGIDATTVQIVRVETADGAFEERLSVFALLEDGDGPRDFSALRLTSDATELEWTIDSGAAAVRLRGKDRWVGSAQLAPPIGESLPTGEYTLVVEDLAGNEAVRKINVPSVVFPERAPVRLTLGNGSWSLEKNPDQGDFRRTFFFLEDDEGKLLYSWRVPESSGAKTSGTVDQLRSLARNATLVQCYTENGLGTAGVLLRPLYLE